MVSQFFRRAKKQFRLNADRFLAAFQGRTFKDVENIGQIKIMVF
jgi:hypothetical protein